MKAIILAAGIGKRIKNYTEEPKCLIQIKEKPLLKRYIEALSEEGIGNVIIVLGYKKERILKFLDSINFNGKTIYNKDFRKGSILSLKACKDELNDDIILMDADVFFEKAVLKKLLYSSKKNLFLIDTTSKNNGEEYMIGIKKGRVIKMGRLLEGEFDCLGEWVGFLKVNKDFAIELKALLENGLSENIGYEEAISFLLNRIPFEYELVDGLKWVEIDFIEDARKAEFLAKDEF